MSQETIYYTKFSSQNISLCVASNEMGLCFIGNTTETFEDLMDWCDKTFDSYSLKQDAEFMEPYVKELKEYFRGERTNFTVPINPKGTAFQKRVWEEARRIPYGKTISYGELAENIGKTKKASRAVGGALGKNPIMVVTPCHRILSSDGKLNGFTGGVKLKSLLLDLENASYKKTF